MNNVTTAVEGDTLVIRINISRDAISEARPSASGKTVLVASTGGAMPVPSKHTALTLSLNLMAKR